jgi:surface antigen
MKKTKKTISLLLAMIMMFSTAFSLSITAEAANNPYPTISDAKHDGSNSSNCTRYAWQRVYEKLGVAMPKMGDAKNWYSNAKLDGYETSSTAKANWVAVFGASKNNSYGHVAFVESVNGNKMTISEGNYYNSKTGKYGYNKRTVSTTANLDAGTNWSAKIIGFFNPKNLKTYATINYKNVTNITNSTATVNFNTSHTYNKAVTKVGIQIRKSSSSSWQKTYTENVKSNYQKTNPLPTTYVIGKGKEVNFTLSKGTTYKYRAFAVMSGKTYYGAEKSFTTSGGSSSSTTTTTTKAKVTNPSVTVNAVSNLSTNSAQINFTANNPSKVTIKTVGVQVRKKGASSWTTKTEAMNSSYTNSTSVKMWWTVGSGKEVNMSLSSNTTYEYRAYVVYNGTNYYSSTSTFTTKSSTTMPSVTVNAVSNLTKSSAQINFTANNPSKLTIKTVGVQVRKKGSSSWTTKTEAMNKNYTNSTSVKMWWTVGSGKEVNMKLSSNTTYEYRAYVVYNGTNYYSATKTFTTKS